ncbi:MAG: AAA family ATPase [Clostridia bacterium]|nr:AAA family ATPase [Clostridia bacterium]
MKLVEINIAGFGKLSDVKIGFGDGLNSFKWDNGEGKSTLCEFITAMFYGMESTKANDKELKPRAHYLPFAGGVYGGAIVFKDVVDGRETECRIERTFDKKSATQDVVRYYIGGELRPAGDVGYEIFGVGQETFRKLVYMNPFVMVPEGNSEISGKIGNFEGDETGRFTKAREDIDNAKKELRAKRAVSGGGGKIPVLEKEIDELSIKLRTLENVRKTLPDKYLAREEAIGEISARKELLKNLSERQNVLEKWDEYGRRAEMLKAKEKRLSGIAAKYPSGFPKDYEINNMCEAARTIKINRGLYDMLGFSAEDKARYDKISEYIDNGRNSQYGDDSAFGIDFERLENDISDVYATEANADAREEAFTKGSTIPGHAELAKKFSGREAEADRLAGEIGALERTVELASAALVREKRESGEREEKRRRSSTLKAVLGTVLLTLGIAAAAVGIILLAAGYPVRFVSYLLIGGGAALAVIGVIMFIARAAANGKNGGNSIEALENAFDAAKRELDDRLAAFGPEYTGSHGAVLFSENHKTFTANLRLLSDEKIDLSRVRSRIADKRASVDRFFEIFDVRDGSLRQKLEALKSMRNEHKTLSEKLESSRETGSTIERAKQVLSAFIKTYMPETSVSELSESPETVRTDVQIAKALYDEVMSDRKSIEEFKAALGSEERPLPADDAETARKAEELKAWEARLREIEIDIRSTENEVSYIGECQSKIAEAKEKLEAANVFYAELDFADKLIERAEKELKDRYIGPVSKKFDSYREALSEAVGASVTMRRDFTVEYESAGAIRSQSHLSTGQLACVALCVRMALTEGIMGDDNCFFVLDDPFMSLSNNNLEAVKGLLKKLSKNRQIIYLTCSNERML